MTVILLVLVQAESVMEVLVRLAAHGRTLLAVIHQPRSSVYDLVNNLLLLSEGRVSWVVHGYTLNGILIRCCIDT